MILWFLAIAALGVGGIVQAPRVLQALNPAAAFHFLGRHGWEGMVVLGGVVLCFAGAEALFADLSHFGRLPIKLGWYGLVLPALILNYFGQGALLLIEPTKTLTPFFALVPHDLLYPIVALATAATSPVRDKTLNQLAPLVFIDMTKPPYIRAHTLRGV